MSFHTGLTWCSNPDCVCGRKGPVCPEWMGCDESEPYDEGDLDTWPAQWCPRCGWEREDHQELTTRKDNQ